MLIANHRRIASAVLLFSLCSSFVWQADSQTTSSTPRRTIAPFFDKLRAGKAVTVAWLGGSITAGAGASDAARTSYRALVTQWLRDRFPQATINEINACVGGTGSAYAAMRVRRDVIAHKPDLVFIEFAINDWNETEKSVRESLEGTIRQLLLQPQPPEIVMIYTTRASHNTRAAWHEAVADYYHLPSVNLEPGTLKFIESQEITPENFWKDGLHPLDIGHKCFANLITTFLAEQEKLKPVMSPASLPAFLEQEALTYGESKPFAEFKPGANWKTEPAGDPLLPAKLLTADKPGAEFETTFEGSAVGLVYRAGPDAGIIECLIDGKPAPAPLARIDCYNKASHIQTRIITSGLDPSLHKLTIKISSEHNPKSTGHRIRLGSLLVGGQRPERL
ncbi:MAG: SGNH/GDSL hydrolase family protein [Blastocatellia bacterium]